ncbi:hypothetical protein E4H04_09605 [Candidatus Bathyarchaeota archaeon]|jgi:3-deoxy-D-arabino-heptulosonate 7-phosphate (DAHP) synthase|nr:MAG: hypothetical protein E4H04_09605 [Candidatus Bathyarchaeota archaeon]
MALPQYLCETPEQSNRVFIIAGPCAIESEEQINDITYKIGLIKDIAEPYNINFMCRGGSWKPRTLYRNKQGEHIFEGLRKKGLRMHVSAAKKRSLPVVTELVSERDLRYFKQYLVEKTDFIQVGARTSQAFSLLHAIGETKFSVLLKNPQHGVDINEAIGSLQRFENNRTRIYCTRGQKRTIDPSGEENKAYRNYMKDLNESTGQHPDSRNLNNIEAIHGLRKNQYFTENNLQLCHDPSHTWGGKTELIRRKIGESAIRALTDYGYDGIIVEVDDRSGRAICDADQAIPISINGVDWSQTNYVREPEIPPITLVEIVSSTMDYQVKRLGIESHNLGRDKKDLESIEWDIQV